MDTTNTVAVSDAPGISSWTYQPIPQYDGWDPDDNDGVVEELLKNEEVSPLWLNRTDYLAHFERAGSISCDVLIPLIAQLNFLTGLNLDRTLSLALSSPVWQAQSWNEFDLKELILNNARHTKSVYNKRSPNKAMAVDAPLAVVRPVYETEGRDLLPLMSDDKGKLVENYANTLRALSQWQKHENRFFYDAFTDTLYHNKLTENEMVPVNDVGTVILDMHEMLESKYFHKVARSHVEDSIRKLANLNTYDSAQEHLLALKWDGVPRVRKMLSTYFGAEDNYYTEIAGEYLMTSLAARTMDPGHKVDMMLILSGEMGLGKTSAIEALAGEGLSATLHVNDTKDDDLARLMKGKLIFELAEFQPGRSKKGIQRLRAFVTATVERWVAKYKEGETIYKRRGVFIATINEIEVLNDPEGERRYLPIRALRPFDIEGLRRDRDQLWAEGLFIFKEHGIPYKRAAELAKAEHQKFKVSDAWDGALLRFARSAYKNTSQGALKRVKSDGKCWGEVGFSADEAASGALELSLKEVTFQVEDRIKARLRTLGFQLKQTMRDGERKMRWVIPKESLPSKPAQQAQMDLEDAA